MKIAMGNDHSAVEMKTVIREYVEAKGYEVIDFQRFLLFGRYVKDEPYLLHGLVFSGILCRIPALCF